MLEKLYNYFEQIVGDDVYCHDQTLTVNLTSHYGNIKLICDFATDVYIVIGEVDEDQYCNLFEIDSEDIDREDFDAWNTTDKYTELAKALERAEEILDAMESETGGCDVFDLDGETIFEDAIDILD